MIELNLLCEKKDFSKIEERMIFALMCIVMKTN